MKAALFKEKNLPLRFEEVATPIPSKGQVLVKLRAAALNHRDLWIQKEQAIPSASGIILGSDGSGIIDSVGEAVDETLIGQEVVMSLEGPLGISLLFHHGRCFGNNFPSSALRWVRKMNFFL